MKRKRDSHQTLELRVLHSLPRVLVDIVNAYYTTPYDEASYRVGHNWIWFRIRCTDTIAEFRLHMERAPTSFDLLRMLDNPSLFCEDHPSYSYGSQTFTKKLRLACGERVQDVPRCTGCCKDDDRAFEWLETFLRHGNTLDIPPFSDSYCESHGVGFHKAGAPSIGKRVVECPFVDTGTVDQFPSDGESVMKAVTKHVSTTAI